MAEYFAGGHLRFFDGEWRDDDGNVVEVVEVKRGEWLAHEELFYDGEFHSEYSMKGYKCSECGRVAWHKEPYCHCGADMRGDV